ncbi:MAG: matrixin family metalloprotease [Gemmatimonadaceae bacterium]
MKRLDLALLATLSSFAVFVCMQARETRAISVEREGHGEAAALDRKASARRGLVDSARGRLLPVISVRTKSPARPALGPDEVLRRVRERAGGTFIDDVIVAHDSALARWPDRLVNPLRVWVQNGATLPDWSEERNTIVRQAFSDWSDTGLPLSFAFVVDSATADVHVTWTDHFNESISGKTLWAHNDGWWIVDASIQLAVHHRDGTALDFDATRAIALHEVGHLIGLDHTRDTTSIMTPRVRVKDLSIADRSTAYLLYSLPPGPLGSSRARLAAR